MAEEKSNTYERDLDEEYRVRFNDILSVKLNSLENTTETYFNERQGGSGPQMGGVANASMFLSGYIVNKDGNINIPLIGDIKVEGLATSEIKKIIDSRLEEYLKFASVSVKLINFRVSVLGEVNDPGMMYFYESQVSIFDAISSAGDFTDFANRERVKIIRKGKNKKVNVKYLNFLKPEIITDEYYFIKPNDVIYVEPAKIKAVNINTNTLSITISALSIVLVAINIFLTNRN